VKTGNNARNGGKNSLNRLIRCVCGKKIGPDPRNFNQRVSLGRNDLLIRTFPREHSLRELGKRLEVTYGTSMTKEEIALKENLSPAKVTRAFQAAAVPDEMVAVFPVINDISLSDYQFLLKLAEEANNKQTSVTELMEKVQHRLKTMPDYPAIDKSKILAAIRVESKSLTTRPTRTVQTEKLREFSDRNQFARKKTDSKKRLVVYEFSRISAEAQSEIDDAIKRILKRLPESSE
ncbi:ParB family protein, partial [Klebsiella pneumoniae]|uniref:ParB family protein n=1 Tax=Klebsiella pneumoniae TaxID=573 RepID=UPI003F9F1AA7